MIKNIIYDVGNVLVHWKPYDVLAQCLPDYNPQLLFSKMENVWFDLNKGLMTIDEAILLFHQELEIPVNALQKLMKALTEHQTPIDGALELLAQFQSQGYPLYAITDNIKEFIQYHHEHSAWPSFFLDIVSSADIGILKPSPEIFEYFLNKHQLQADECLFFDDLACNVQGARDVGLHSIIFTNVLELRRVLVSHGIQLDK